MSREIEPYQLLARFYDGGWYEYSQYISELIEQMEEENRRPFRRICDAACGTGLLLRFLGGDDEASGDDEDASASPPRSLCGYDISTPMLQRARERVPEATLRVGDLRGQPPFHGPFDLFTCVYDALNYLHEEEEVLTFFTAAAARLAAGGVLLVDLNDPTMYLDRHGSVQPRLIDGVAFRETLSYQAGPPPMGITTFSFPEGEEVHRQRAWTFDEVEDLLTRAGLYLLDSLDVLEEGSSRSSGKIVYIATARGR